MERAIIYARVSTLEQGQGYSLGTQMESCRRYCDAHGYQIIGEYTDTHSGTETERPGVTQLIEEAARIRPDVVVLHDVDRLGREIVVQAILERDIQRSGARLEFVLGGDSGTAEGELLKLVKGALSVYENRQRVERSRRGKAGRVKAGHPFATAARTPYGYRYIGEPHRGRFEIDEAEAAVVRRMVDWLLLDRLSCYQIAKRLSEAGTPTRADQYPGVVSKKAGQGEWSGTAVRGILRNPALKGEWFYGKTRRKKRTATVKADGEEYKTRYV